MGPAVMVKLTGGGRGMRTIVAHRSDSQRRSSLAVKAREEGRLLKPKAMGKSGRAPALS
jgi:hypothetical protein